MAKRVENALSLTGVDPRVRMKEVRAEVSAFLKGSKVPQGMNHMGDLPGNMEDARRVIIALQDLLEKELVKHGKATGHICQLVHIMDTMAMDINDLQRIVENRDHDIRLCDEITRRQQQEILELRGQVQQANQERNAVLTTMKIMGDPRQTVSAPMTMGVDMGSSNAAGPVHRRSTAFEELLKGMTHGGTISGRFRP